MRGPATGVSSVAVACAAVASWTALRFGEAPVGISDADGVVGVAGVVLWWSSLIVEVGVPPSSLSSRMKEPWCSDSRTFRFKGVDERDEERVGGRRRNATRSNTGDVAILVDKMREDERGEEA